MELTEAELDNLGVARRNIGILGSAGSILGAVGGYLMVNGSQGGGGRLIKAFVIGSTMFAGTCLGLGLGIQNAFHYLGKRSGSLAEAVQHYQELMVKARRSGGAAATGSQEDLELETRFRNEIHNRKLKDVTKDA